MWKPPVKTVHPLVRELFELGVTKWAIAAYIKNPGQQIKYAWTKVRAWEMAAYGPNQEAQAKLEELIKIVKVTKAPTEKMTISKY